MRISRIYVDRFGSKTGWYEQTTLDFCDPITGEPIDACINLENAGGKTSLLSYIFSCFDPRVDRWLQTLQSDSHAFRDYFAHDARPSFLITEWIMPPRSANGAEYRLVVGQVVHFTESSDRAAESERRFFSFQSNEGLRWEDLPVPGISMAPVKTLQDFLGWIQQTARSQRSGDIFATRNQGEWTAHLENQRQIDLELLKMQVSFNSREGGSEEGFLSFSSESELVSRLLSLSLNQDHTAELRNLVAQTMDRLKAKPKHEMKLRQLADLRDAITPFSERALELQGARKSLLEVEQSATDLSHAMRRRVSELDVRVNSAKAAIAQLEIHCSTVTTEASKARSDFIALSGHRLEREAVSAKKRFEDLREKLDSGQRRVTCLKAAKATRNIRSIVSIMKELEGEKDAATQELKPLEEEAQTLGAQLRHLLQLQISGLDKELTSLVDKLQKAKDEKVRLTDLRAEKNLQAGALQRRQGEIKGVIGAAQEIYEGLAERGLLLPVDIDVRHAVSRVSALIEELTAQLAELNDQRAQMAGQLETKRGQLGSARQTANDATAAQTPLVAFLRDYEVILEELQNDPLIIAAVDGDCDPYSVVLVDAIQQMISLCKDELSKRLIRLDQLSRERESITQTGLAGRNEDVAAVVAALIKAGIRSARPANTYLAELRPNVDEARSLVLSDPSRYLGVNVAAQEWDRATNVVDSLSLSLSMPVTLAVASLEMGAKSDERLVLRPHNDSAYNVEAAKLALAQFDVTIEAVHAEQDAYADRQRAHEQVLSRVRSFQELFARQLVFNAETELKASREQHKLAMDTIERLGEEVLALGQGIVGLGSRIEGLNGEIARKGSDLSQLQSYMSSWEPRIGPLRKELQEVEGQLGLLDSALEELKELYEQEERTLNDAHEAHTRVRTVRGDFDRERSAILRTNENLSVEALARPGASIDDLRLRYRFSDSRLSVAERDLLGLIAHQLDEARGSLQKATADYVRDFPSVTVDQVEPLIDLDIEAEILGQEHRNRVLDEHKEAALGDSRAKETEHRLYWDERKFVAPSEEMLALGDEELQGAADRRLKDAEDGDSLLQSLWQQVEQENEKAKEDLSESGELSSQLKNLEAAFSFEALVPRPATLSDDVPGQVRQLVRAQRAEEQSVKDCQKGADNAYRVVLEITRRPQFIEAEGDIAERFATSDVDAACEDRARLIEMVADRISAVEDNLAAMTPDFEHCVMEVHNHVTEAISLLKLATEIRLPLEAPYVGGRSILKMSANLQFSVDHRKDEIRSYLNRQIASGLLPRSGAEILTQCLLALTPRQSFGLQILKMEQNTDFQYQPVNNMKKSGGQGTVIAVFLYMLVSHLRVDTQARANRGGGGPLLMDNPFANVQTRALIDAQRMLAESLKIQLICFTANADANILEGFRRIVRLRKAGVNKKTRRTHIEMATATFESEGRRA